MSLCKECTRPIVWAKTLNKKAMALDAEAGVDGANIAVRREGRHLVGARAITADRPLLLDEIAYKAHWATCPAADKFRRTHPSTTTTRNTQPAEMSALF